MAHSSEEPEMIPQCFPGGAFQSGNPYRCRWPGSSRKSSGPNPIGMEFQSFNLNKKINGSKGEISLDRLDRF